jgi:hypothetical protein
MPKNGMERCGSVILENNNWLVDLFIFGISVKTLEIQEKLSILKRSL